MSIFEAELFTRILLGYTSHQDIGKTWEKSALDEMKRDHYSGFSSCFFFNPVEMVILICLAIFWHLFGFKWNLKVYVRHCATFFTFSKRPLLFFDSLGFFQAHSALWVSSALCD